MRLHSPTRECVRRKENMPTMVMTTTVSTVSMQRCVRARRQRATTTMMMKMHRPAWRNGLNRPNIVAVASTSNDDSWNAAIGKEKVRVTADERVVLFEFGVDPVWTTTTTEVEDDGTKMQKREEEVARADDDAFVESVVSLTAEQSQEEESVEEIAVPKPKTTTTTTTTTPSLSKMKKAELVALCEELGVDSTGTVPALRGRLGPVLRARAK